MEAHPERREEMAAAAHRGQKAIRPPSPVTDDGIDETRDRYAVEQVSDETGATDHRT